MRTLLNDSSLMMTVKRLGSGQWSLWSLINISTTSRPGAKAGGRWASESLLGRIFVWARPKCGGAFHLQLVRRLKGID